MSSRMNGYDSERILRPSSEQMADLHVYLVPPDIWREKFNNALNQHINDTVSLGFIRVHPETKVFSLRDEIEQQLGADLVPREFVFLKSVGRSLTRLKSRQEATMKVKHFLPPHAYAPELYLLEATPEVRQAIAASSEGSTRPETRTSYDFEFARQSDDSARRSHLPYGAGSYYPTLPKIPPSAQSHAQHTQPTSSNHIPSAHPRSSPQVRNYLNRDITKTPGPKSLPDNNIRTNIDHNDNETIHIDTHKDNEKHIESHRHNHPSKHNQRQPPQIVLTNCDTSEQVTVQTVPIDPSEQVTVHTVPIDSSPHAVTSHRSGAGLHTSDTHPDPHHHSVNSPRRGHTDKHVDDQYLPPLSATPPHSAGDKTKPTNNTSKRPNIEEDSGIAGFSPDTYRGGNDNHILDRRKEPDETKAAPPQIHTDQSDPYPLQKQDDDRDKSNWETTRFGETDRRSPELARRLSKDNDNDEREHEEERHQIEEEVRQMKNTADEDMTRYPSPPPLRLASPDRESESAKERKRKEREELLKQLEKARESRKAAERMREELVKQAKLMQNKTQNRRNHARDIWKKRYFEEKKKTGPLEDQMNKLRHELDIIHKRLLSTLEGPKEKATKLGDVKHPLKGPAQQKPLNNFKVQATRLQHEIEDIRRRVEHAKMRLTSEMKLRNQAETELRALRAELTQKKINLTLSRNSNLTTYAPPAADVNLISARTKAITPRS